jgi:hypothetical protein
MAGVGAMCMLLFGVFFMVASIRRPHPSSEVGSLTGSSRAVMRLMGFATGVWLIAVAVEASRHDLHAVLVTFEAYGVLFVVLMLAALADGPGRVGSAHRRDPALRPQEPSPRRPGSIHYRYYR